MYKFFKAVIAVFSEVCLSEPNVDDTIRIFSINEARKFLRMIGSIDCMHLKWKNYPFAWKGQYSGHVKGCIMILEVVTS
jgi:hypothetical protein